MQTSMVEIFEAILLTFVFIFASKLTLKIDRHCTYASKYINGQTDLATVYMQKMEESN